MNAIATRFGPRCSTSIKAGAKWHLETPGLEKLAIAEQEARFKLDPWYEVVETWIDKRVETSVADILTHAFGKEPKTWSRSAEMRVVDILTLLGFHKVRSRAADGTRPNRYRRD